MYTSHGHHIGGTTKGSLPANMVARCGGPKLCDVCFREALQVNTQLQSEKAGGSMFMSPYQMHQVAAKMRANNPKPDGGMPRDEYLLSKTLYEFAKALDDVATDIENGN
ncbi:hypothetical protein PBI_SPORTO_70 [Arthrobacter phage Sporto]|nr:hypothetical protein PBI_SPORTO_70 [Arthrobacter phage Sporto]